MPKVVMSIVVTLIFILPFSILIILMVSMLFGPLLKLLGAL